MHPWPRKTGGGLAAAVVAALLAIAAGPVPGQALTVEAVGPDTVRGTIRDIEAAEGSVWAAASTGIYRIEKGGRAATRFTAKDGLPSGNAYSVAIYRGKVYAGTDAGLAVYDGRRWEVPGRILNVRLGRYVYASVDRAADTLYVSSVYVSGGLLSFDGTKWTFLGGRGYGLLNTIVSFGFADNEAWLGTWNGVIYRMGARGIDPFRASEGFTGKRVYGIAAGAGKVYAATDAGLCVFEGGAWKTFDPSPAAGSRELYAVALSGDAVYAGGPLGVMRFRGKVAEAAEDPSGRTKSGVFSLASIDGSLYAGTRDGIVILKGWP